MERATGKPAPSLGREDRGDGGRDRGPPVGGAEVIARVAEHREKLLEPEATAAVAKRATAAVAVEIERKARVIERARADLVASLLERREREAGRGR